MKKHPSFLVLALIGLLAVLALHNTTAATEPAPVSAEYATVCWAGARENMRVVLPDGKVDLLGARLARTTLPDGTEPRLYYLNHAMNALGKEGWEFAGMADDQIVMKRAVRR
jgi:hypothetical protein